MARFYNFVTGYKGAIWYTVWEWEGIGLADILIVEDEASIRQILGMHLTLVGHTVREAEEAASARALMAERAPDLALLASMAGEAQRLSDMDARLLQLTRLEHDAPEFTRFSSMEMAREALSAFEGVELGGEDAQFLGERELTIQLLRNLVVNAQRAGGDAPVRVTMRADVFTVTDHGCGMTKEQLSHAFEPFYKADKSRTRAAGGAGLGLTLCRKIAELHGGKLEIDSEPGRGTAVCYAYRFDKHRARAQGFAELSR